jgi:gliding motility-associated-like protein
MTFLSLGIQATIDATFTYSYTTTSRCGSALVSFTNNSTSSAPFTSMTMFYGDGGSSSSSLPSISIAPRLYVTAGTFCPILVAVNSLGERDTFRASPCITVFPNPTINLDIDSANNCDGIVCINNLSNPGTGCSLTSVLLDCPGSTAGLVTSMAPRICLTYPTPGDYSITARLTNSCGCVVTALLTDTIHYVLPPVASFTSGPSVGCGASLSVPFTNTSSSATSYIWRFQRTAPTVGPITTFSTLANPTQVFPTGTYDITLVAINAAGCRDSVTIPSYVVVSATPTIDFSLLTTTPLCGNTVVTFRPTTPSTGSYSWTITPTGGASPSTGSSYDFTTTITASTTYTVTVVQTIGGSCTATRTRTFPITVFNPPSGTYTYTGACHERCRPADTITYTASGLACPSPTCTYSWNFPGAVAPTTRTGLGPHTVIYNTFGTFNYGTLTITDARGCITTYTAPGQIKITDYTNNITIGTQRRGCTPLTVPFNDITTVNLCDSVVSRIWNFGSAGTSTIKNPSISFTTPGCYNLSLITTTRLGCTDTLRMDTVVCVVDTPVVSFNATPNTMCFEDSLVRFSVTGVADSFYWDFGDPPRISTRRDTISRFYTDTGVFYPSVVGFVFGCPSRVAFSDTIVILSPIAGFRDSISCTDRNRRYFINTSGGLNMSAGDSVFWDFGVSSSILDTSSLLNPNFLFPDTGCYSVRLQVWSRSTGCDHSISRTICIRNPIVDFTTTTRDTCFDSRIRLTNISSSIRSGSSTRFFVQGRWLTFGTASQLITFDRTSRPCNDSIKMINISSDGCRDTITKRNFLNIRTLTSAIRSTSRAGCVPLTVNFTDSLSIATCSGTMRIRWDFGDPSTTMDTSTLHDPSYTYTIPGTYSVRATVFDSMCSDVSNILNVIVVNPQANFSVDTLHCVNNGPITLTNLSTGYRPTYSWLFPGGSPSSSSLQNPPPVTYSTPGIYTITLISNDTLGCTDTISQNIRIYEPISNFGVADSFFVCDGGLIAFYDSSFSNICSWQWDFGDGTGSTLQNPSHLYAQPGNYTVMLIVQSCDGCIDTLIKNSYIVIKGPSGSFTFAPNNVCKNGTVTTTIQSRNSTQMYYLNGISLTSISHTGFIPEDSLLIDIVTYTYTDTGVYFPQLLLTDSSGCNIPFSPGLSITVDSLLVNFGTSTLNRCDTGTICFYDSSRYLVTGRIPTIFNWTFGDGTTSTLQNPCHKYTAPGTYRVRLYVNNPLAACADSVIKFVTIAQKPTANFSRSDSIQCVSDPIVNFIDLSTRGDTPIVSWNWLYRPLTSSSTLQNPNFDFTTAGTYNVLLTVTDSIGCTDSISKVVTIIADPISNAGRDTTICLGNSTRLNGSGGVTYNWSPATFLSATNISNPLCTPDSTISYILTATDAAGCTDVDTVTVFVSRVISNYSNDTVCFGSTTVFTDLSTTNIGTLTTRSWNFGDIPSGTANTSALTNPTHAFTSSSIFNVRLITTNSFGCTDDTIMSISLLLSPVARFSATTACVRDSTLFTDLSSTSAGSIVSWAWNFGETGTILDTSNLQNPRWVYSAAGTYNVRLSVRNQGCSKDTTISVIVNGRPTANFRVDSTCIYSPAVYTDLSTSTRGISIWSWNFGDLSTLLDISSIRNPSYTFPSTAPTNYNTTLTITDSNGCTDDTIRTTTVVPLPIASFLGDTICPGDTMSFTDLSTNILGSTVRWHWDFGITSSTTDTSNIRNPRFPYSSAGSYNVNLTIYSRYGCIDDTTLIITVQPPIVANFTMDSVCLGDSMRFTDASVALAGSVASWNWNFSSPPNSTLQNPSYLYSTSGSRVVNLRVTSSFGCIDDTSKTVYVFANPIARFTADSVCLGDSNHLISLSSGFSFPIASYLWQLTPTITASGTNTSYQYPTGGANPVTLTVTDGFGCVDDTTFNVTTFTLPTANFSYGGGCGTLPVNFSNTSLNGSGGLINGYFWNFDDAGVTSSISSPSHSYSDSSAHDVLFVVTDVRGCIDSIIKPVTPGVIPYARFNVSPDIEVCLGVPICFSNLSTVVNSGIASFAWDINGDLISDYTDSNICHTYTTSGVYRVTLTVVDSAGCQDTASILVRINQPPVANFSWDTTCENTPMVFTDLSVAGSGIINSWNWSFGDFSGDVIQNPTHAYADSGAYPVTLFIEDDNGCRDTASQTVLVDWQSNVSAYSDTSICQGNSVILHADGAILYDWLPNLYLDRDDSAYVVATPNTSINYTVYGYGQYRVCPPTTQQITVQVLPAMPFNVTAVPQVIILGSTSQLTGFPAGAIDSIIWTPNTTLTCDDCIDPVSEPPATTTYVATIYYSLLDAYCNTADTVTVTVYDQCPKEIFYMPNTFTPNGDGQNDIFYPRGYGVKDLLVFRVFDRWGNLVHERTNAKANDANVGWLGFDKNGTKQLNPGVYVYYIEGTCSNDDKVSFSGNITLIR